MLIMADFINSFTARNMLKYLQTRCKGGRREFCHRRRSNGSKSRL